MSNPALLPSQFANTALPANLTNPLPTPATGTNAASWNQGFPPITMTPKSSGGLPPFGADVNGALFAITAHTVFLQGGHLYFADAAILGGAGYDKGAVVMLNDESSLVMSLINANTQDPNNITLSGNWATLAGPGSRYAAFASRATDALVCAFSPAVTAAPPGNFPFIFEWTGNPNASGAVTIDLGWGPLPVRRSDDANLVAGDLPNISGAGVFQVYHAVAVVGVGAHRASYVQLLEPVLSQSASAISALAVNGTTLTSETMAGANLPFVVPPSGKLLVQMMGEGGQSPGTVGGTVKLYWGTGAPPAAAAPVPGGSTSFSSQTVAASTNGSALLWQSKLTGLTPGATIWVDASVASATGGSQFTSAMSILLSPQVN